MSKTKFEVFEKGESVCFSEHAKESNIPTRNGQNRVGIVTGFSHEERSSVGVRWDGTKSAQYYHKSFIEKCKAALGTQEGM